jgi:XTP/dITP diphosphohydrolase
MHKIKEIVIGTNNPGKYREICDLLPNKIKKYSPKKIGIKSPKETGKTFEENSFIKASYFSKKTNLICLSDDSGLEIDFLKGDPGIYSSRWAGKKNNFNLAIKKIYSKMKIESKGWDKNNSAKFICCMTLFWPNGKTYSSTGIIKGKISINKKGGNGFGYDPIFIPHGYSKTFGQMKPELKMSIDHRFKAFKKIKKFFT